MKKILSLSMLMGFLIMGNLASAQQFLVTSSQQAKFDWQFPLTLGPTDTFQFECQTVPVTTPILVSTPTMPLSVASVLTVEGSYTCAVRAIIAGVIGPLSNVIQVTLKNSKIVITY